MRRSRATLLQQCGHYRWEGQYNDDWLVHKSVEVNEYLVKGNVRTLRSLRRRCVFYRIIIQDGIRIQLVKDRICLLLTHSYGIYS